MQVRSVAPATSLARRPLAAAAAAKPAVQPAAASKPQGVARPQVEPGFGSEIFQTGLYGLVNAGTALRLPGLSNLVGMLPAGGLGMVNLVLGGMNAFKDVRGLSKEGNTKKSDDYTRLAGDAAVIAGGAALMFGAALAPAVPLIGAGVAALGFMVRAVGVWNDQTRW